MSTSALSQLYLPYELYLLGCDHIPKTTVMVVHHQHFETSLLQLQAFHAAAAEAICFVASSMQAIRVACSSSLHNFFGTSSVLGCKLQTSFSVGTCQEAKAECTTGD